MSERSTEQIRAHGRILEAADMDEALAWARKGAITCDAVGEVRELLFYPDPKTATE